MPPKKAENTYAALRSALDAKNPARCYVFHGEERYLLENALQTLRRIILPGGLNGFGYHRFDGAVNDDDLFGAVASPPFMSERTLVELWDYPMPAPRKDASDSAAFLTSLLSALPEYVCVVFVYDTVEWKPDKRVKATQELIAHMNIVDFQQPDTSDLVKWIRRHFASHERDIAPRDAEYLVTQAGADMTRLLREIEKLAAYRESGAVTRADIDALVEKTLDTKLYNLTDAIAERRFDAAFSLYADIADMREPAQAVISGLARHTRRLYLARLYLDGNRPITEFMSDSGVTSDWQAKRFYSAARKMTADQCRRAVLLCCDCAFSLNSGGGSDDLTLLIAKLAS